MKNPWRLPRVQNYLFFHDCVDVARWIPQLRNRVQKQLSVAFAKNRNERKKISVVTIRAEHRDGPIVKLIRILLSKKERFQKSSWTIFPFRNLINNINTCVWRINSQTNKHNAYFLCSLLLLCIIMKCNARINIVSLWREWMFFAIRAQ